MVLNEKWDKRFLKLAYDVSQWSKDPSRKVGAVIVGAQKQIVSQGFNGFPRGINDSEERLNTRQEKYKYVVHAEANAIYNALYNGCDVRGCTIYVVGLPVCSECAKAIIQCGITRVVMSKTKVITQVGQFDWNDSNQLSLEMFSEVGIEYTFVEME